MRRVTFKLGFRNKTVAQKISICENFLGSVAKLPEEKRPYARVEQHLEELAATKAAVSRLEALAVEMRTALAQRNRLLKQLCLGVTLDALSVSGAAKDPGEILGAGLALPREKKPVGRPGVATKFVSLPTRVEGAVFLRWKRSVRRCTAVVQIATGPNGTHWKHYQTCCSSKCVVTGLKPGVQYWFRVALVNAHGQGPWTTPLPARAA